MGFVVTEWVDLPLGTEAPRSARRVLKDVLEGRVSTDVLGRALLLTTELITIGLEQVAGRPEPLQLCLDVDDVRIRVTIVHTRPGHRDPSGRFAAPLGALRFAIIDRLSDRWGLVRSRDGATAWTEVELG